MLEFSTHLMHSIPEDRINLAMPKAPFITFEGGEGSGKSTQIDLLYRKLREKDLDVISCREPGGTPGAEDIRSLLLKGDEDKWTPITEALLMSASRSDLIQKRIMPHLEKGWWVLCDRFTDSTIAYQGYGHELGEEAIVQLNQFTVGRLQPTLTFIFQIDPQQGLLRAAKRTGEKDRYEQLDLTFHRRVEEGYAEILRKHPSRCVAIDAAESIELISARIYKEVCKRFRKVLGPIV